MCQDLNCRIHGSNHITLILKLVDFCNFDCDFCRYHNNLHQSKMSIDIYMAAIEKACEYNLHNGFNRLNVIYHGGEPLLWGIETFEKAISVQQELKKRYPKIVFKNSIQTNGSLLNSQFTNFFKENEFNLGISIDGPDDINFHKNFNGNRIVFENMKMLNEAGCHFGVLSVITDKHAGRADEYYKFLIENNIHSVGLCYCVYDEDEKITVKNDILTDFLLRFFDLYYHGSYKLSVREFESVIRLCLGAKTNACTYSYRSGCGNYFSVRPNGDVLFCDPYTLGKPALGNILSENFFDIKSKPELIQIVKDAKYSIVAECDKCDIRNICGGGCYRNLFGEKRNAFCETFRIVYPYIKKTVDRDINK